MTGVSLLSFCWSLFGRCLRKSSPTVCSSKLDNISLSPFPRLVSTIISEKCLHSNFSLRLWFERNTYQNSYPRSGYSKLLWNDCWTNQWVIWWQQGCHWQEMMYMEGTVAGEGCDARCLILWHLWSLKYNKTKDIPGRLGFTWNLWQVSKICIADPLEFYFSSWWATGPLQHWTCIWKTLSNNVTDWICLS